MILSAKLYVLIVTLSINDDIKFLEDQKQGLNNTYFWELSGKK